MSLKDAINNTNIQKEKLKTVANNIDNKLVKLGGERATDLSDVPNRITALKKVCKKRAIVSINKTVYASMDSKTESININLDFNPSMAFVHINNNIVTNNNLKYYINNQESSSNPTTCRITNLSRNNIILQFSYLEQATIKRIEFLGE